VAYAHKFKEIKNRREEGNYLDSDFFRKGGDIVPRFTATSAKHIIILDIFSSL